MSKEIPTPYVWLYEPQRGRARGASQDYSTRAYWMSAGPAMISRLNAVRLARNGLLLQQAAITETPRAVLNPPEWPPALLRQQPQRVNIPTQFSHATFPTAIVGSGMSPPPPKRRRRGRDADARRSRQRRVSNAIYTTVAGARPQSSEAAAAALAAVDRSAELLRRATFPSAPRSGGLGAQRFVEEFVPEVYLNPFAGEPSNFPLEFIPQYDVQTGTVHDY
ncbi:pVIII [Guinea pig adenovirus 1]|uniref:PVIII n=1 Tax=Guinea pig adenovirus 1 TaxID=2847100 RepID=A0AC61M0B6_9ADEN|nr:pVIII [Guinea pig adenovirus]QIZ64168.1 pVIII [Guinea pig adenovirus 1]QIZ64200.1 pVIII [Guinea pig adenovirus]